MPQGFEDTQRVGSSATEALNPFLVFPEHGQQSVGGVDRTCRRF